MRISFVFPLLNARDILKVSKVLNYASNFGPVSAEVHSDIAGTRAEVFVSSHAADLLVKKMESKGENFQMNYHI